MTWTLPLGTISATAQFVVLGGVLFLVPVGLCWTAWRLTRPVQSSPAPAARAPRLLVLVTLAAVAAVGLLAALGTWIGGSVSMGLGVLSIAGVALRWLRRRLATPSDQRRAATAMSAYLVAMPAIALTLNVVLSEPMTVFSRNRAMDKAAVLVSGIERHYADRAAYPDSLVALWPDFRPGIVGIPQYQYARHGNAYTLSFLQPSLLIPGFGREEVVVYNPRDEHLFPSHAVWALESSLERRMANQGWFAFHETGRPHWKYFWFD